ncbi:hypothetical protein M406DRAFT_245834, partial [Cryphonectria parasitica EP155]
QMDLYPDPVDGFLERYLVLLDEYTDLREKLIRLQASTLQHLARANFTAERGARYGADSYDERMQAGRTVVIHETEAGVAFRVVAAGGDDAGAAEEPGTSKGEEATHENDEGKKKKVPADPIRWFGVLTPPALRQAQSCAVDTVEHIIPRLVTVDRAMREVEIEVRRARKRRAKAEAAVSKDLGREQNPVTRAKAAAS